MSINFTKDDIRKLDLTATKAPLEGVLKTDVTLPQPAPAAPDPAPTPDPATMADQPMPRTIVDELLDALALQLVGQVADVVANGGQGLFADSVNSLLDTHRRLARRKSQGTLSDEEFQREVDKAAAKYFRKPSPATRQQRLESLIMTAVGHIAANSSGSVALLPDEFNAPLLDSTAGDLLAFGLSGGVDAPVAATRGGGLRGGFDGLPPVQVTPLFFAVGSNLVRCINETQPTVGADEFRIFVTGSVLGPIDPKLYNDNDAIVKFDTDGVSDSRNGTPRRFEYAMQEMPVGTFGYRVVGMPFEQDQISDKDVRETVEKILVILDQADQALPQNVEALLAPLLGPAGPGTALAISLLRRFLRSGEIRERVLSIFYTVVSSFYNSLPGTRNEAFTPYVLSGTFSRDAQGELAQALLIASVDGNNTRATNLPRAVTLTYDRKNAESIKTISNVEVREIPLGERGRYELTAIIAIRTTRMAPN